MKQAKFKEILIIALFFISTSYANLLTNADFENGSTGWVFDDSHSTETDGEMTIENSAAQNGTMGAHIKVNSISGENWHAQLNIPYNWEAVEGTNYTLTFYAKGTATIHLAAQGGEPDYAYLNGKDITLNDTWKLIEYTYASPANGSGALRFNIYVGGAVGDYYFDNFNLIAEVVSTEDTALTLPNSSFYQSVIYRNPFAEIGKDQTAIDTKVNNAFQQLFYGDEDNEKLFLDAGEDMAFIKAIDSDDIRSEGMSYGMMITVQLDKQEEFNKLWKFAKTYMQHQSGNLNGYFSWQLKTTAPYDMIDPNPAPDGEEYFAMALFFAAKRWGNGTDIFNYEAEANIILDEMLNKTAIEPLINPTSKQIIFSPFTTTIYTDPSYHLPAFYELWALWAAKDNGIWQEVADSSRAFLKKACHGTTGLTSDYSTFSGEPQATSFNGNSDKFAYDSYRVGMNIAMDYNWFKKDEWQLTQSNRWLKFFSDQSGSYGSIYEVDGSIINSGSSEALVAMNGVAAMASSNDDAAKYINAVWNMPIPSGQWRYYNGLLYMLSVLNLSGNYQMYGITNNDTTSSIKGNLSVPLNFSVNGLTIKIIFDNTFDFFTLHNISGKAILKKRISGNGSVELKVKNAGVYILKTNTSAYKFIINR